MLKFKFTLNTSRSLFKPRIKNFFENFFKKNKFYIKQHSFNPEDIIYYEPPDPLLFKEKRFNVLESPDDTKITNILQYGILYPSFFISGYKLITTVIQFKILGSLLWGFVFVYVCRLMRGFTQNKYFMINKLYLLEDGKSVQIFTGANKFIIDISAIRKVTPEEAMYYKTLIGGNDYLPIVVKDDIYILSRNCKIHDKDLFNAISSGNYIKLTGKVDKEDTIDIS
jgi:hypothetical protein